MIETQIDNLCWFQLIIFSKRAYVLRHDMNVDYEPEWFSEKGKRVFIGLVFDYSRSDQTFY